MNMFRPPNQPPMFQQQPFQHGNFMQMMPQRGGLPQQLPVNQKGIQGLLQRFLPGKAATTTAGFSGSTGGSNLMGTLNNVQQVLKVAQQATPLIKEYGPMIKNAPKIFNMMKALNEINKEDGDNEDKEFNESVDELNMKDVQSEEEFQWDTEEQEYNTERTAESRPKLFI
ncbi:VrrA/YqfQ family protein [Gracilibacillus ureilyticus]|nr:VrrA/YqfQ family protein [Gracilibacillus ureilyticus]